MKLTVLLPDLPEEVGSLSDLVVTLDCFDISDECDVVLADLPVDNIVAFGSA